MSLDTQSDFDLTVAEAAKVPPRARRREAWLVTTLAVLLALVVGALLIIFSDPPTRSSLGYVFSYPHDFFFNAYHSVHDAYVALFEGSIYNPSNDGSVHEVLGPITGTLFTAAPLICAGLGITVAFRSGLFNIGGQGQVIAGAMASGYVGFAWTLSPFLHLIVAVVAGVLAGAGWGFIAGFLKARTGANEVITTIMLNYVALDVLHYLLNLSGISQGVGSQASKIIPGSARLPHLAGNTLPKLNLGIVLAVTAAAAVWLLMSRSTVGFRLRAVGLNPAAARTAGMSVSRATMLAMALAGGLAGLGGTTLALGGSLSYQVTPNIDSNVGFDAITVALLGRTSPWGTVAAGLGLGALRQGGANMQAATSVPIDIVTVIQAVIIIFIAAPSLTRAIFRLKAGYRPTVAATASHLKLGPLARRAHRVPRRITVGAMQLILSVLSLWLFGLGVRSGHQALFQFSLPGAAVHLGAWSLSARPAVVVLSGAAIVAAIARLVGRLGPRWSTTVVLAGVVTSFVIWSVASSPTGLNLVSLLQGSVFPAAIPLVLAALAGLIGERAGVVNVGLEGQLLLGAFTAALIGTLTGSIWLGLSAGASSGVLLALLLGTLSIRYLVDQVIVGVVLNVLTLGVTGFLFNQLMAPAPQRYNSPGYLRTIAIPVLHDIPIVGPVLFQGTVFLYGTYAAVGLVSYALFRTRWGLRLRAVGEHPRAADTMGIDVRRTRYRALAIAGVIAGLAGAFLVMGTGSAGSFQLNMSAGKGFIALAAVIFGRWTPRGAVLAALLFGFTDQLQSLLSQANAPIDSNLLLTLPYLATIIVVAGFVGSVRAPAADGQPYTGG